MTNKCKNCGGNLEFNPKENGCSCVNCGSVFAVKSNLGMKKNEFSQAAELKSKSNNEVKSFRCNSCGATMILNKNEIKTTCAYCGNSAISQVGQSKMMTIDSIIPFAFNKEEALEIFSNNVKQSFFANKKILRGTSVENFSGVYVNVFVFDLNVNVKYKGVLSYTKTYRNSRGETQTKVVYRHVRGNFDKLFDNIAIESNSYLNQEELNQILPFDYNKAVDFKTEFTYGYAFEYHNEEFDKCFCKAEGMVKHNIKDMILRKYSCDRVESLDLEVDYIDKKFNYCLLPVYFINKIYKNKNYHMLMNGQTGALSRLPKRVGRILLMIALILLGVAIPVLIIILTCI